MSARVRHPVAETTGFGAPNVPEIPGAINISELTGAEIVSIGIASPVSAQTTTAAIAGLAAVAAGGTVFVLHAIDTRTSPQTFALPAGNASEIQMVYDEYGNALANNITITGAAFPIGINQNNGSIPFFWTGSAHFPF